LGGRNFCPPSLSDSDFSAAEFRFSLREKRRHLKAKNIKKLRNQRGLSQDKLSKLADISHNTIIKIESGAIQSPTMDTAQKIAKALGVSLDDLMKK